jgi:hypothetical protein
MVQVWIVANAWTYGNEDGNSPDLLAAFTDETRAWGYIADELTGADRVNASVWGPVELKGVVDA